MTAQTLNFNPKSSPLSPSAISVHKIILKSAAEAVWLESDEDIKHHLIQMFEAIAARYGKARLDITIQDLHALSTMIHSLAKTTKLSRIGYLKAQTILVQAKKAHEQIDKVSHFYRLALLITTGNAAPLATKYMISIAAPRLKRASITYAAGLLAMEVYRNKDLTNDPISVSETILQQMDTTDFDPIFVHFNREHLSTICNLLQIRVDINATEMEIKQEIQEKFSSLTKNYIVHIYQKVASEKNFSYLHVLDSVCKDLEVEYDKNLSIPEIEQKIVARVLQETIDKLEKEEREHILARIQTISGEKIDLSKISSGGAVAALFAANSLGFGPFIAASSALGALTSGLGITASFSVYTSMSSALATALGPIGISAATALFLATLTKRNPRKAIPAIVYIAAMRAKLMTQLEMDRKKAKRQRLKKFLYYVAVIVLCFGLLFWIF